MWWSTKIEWWVLSSDCKLLTKENIPFQAVKNAYLVWTWRKKKKGGREIKKSFATSMQTLHIHYCVELRERVWKQELHFGALWTMECQRNWWRGKSGWRFLFLGYVTPKYANVRWLLLAEKCCKESVRWLRMSDEDSTRRNQKFNTFNSSAFGK